MSSSMHVVGFKPADDRWQKMKAVWDACSAAKVAAPTAVTLFFNGEDPSDEGVEVSIEKHKCCKKYSEEMREGFDINLADLPADVKVLRFYTSY